MFPNTNTPTATAPPPAPPPPAGMVVFTDPHQALPFPGLLEVMLELEPGKHIILRDDETELQPND